ncbi:MAG TPA: hypothetical protein VGP72_25425 [Planctomycetota bacterium]|jgi:uncharacterized membrane protein YvbJ
MSDDSDQVQCTYCGKMIYADSPRCPKCGNYTDGEGPYQRPMKDGRPINRIYVIAGLLVVVAFLLPLLLALLEWLHK